MVINKKKNKDGSVLIKYKNGVEVLIQENERKSCGEKKLK